MAKKVNKNRVTPVAAPVQKQEVTVNVVKEVPRMNIPAWLHDFRVQAIVIIVLAFVCYSNTFKHEYALDDTIVIVRNDFVHEGFAGIKDILTKDAYYCYYNQLNTSNQLSGGRYRPLSIVTFAIEQQLFGEVPKGKVDSIIAYGLSYDMQASFEKKFLQEMHIRHVLNVVWYALAVVALLYFLRYVVFRNNYIMAFLAAIIFTLHPLHTEVVANVKSRDEIISVLFICLTFIFAFKYLEHKKNIGWLVVALLSYALAFLSKEYAITLVLLLPVSFYIFNKYTIRESMVAALPYMAVVAVYLLIRWQILGPRSELSDLDIQINPYAFASTSEKLATEIATSLNYLKLLLIPYPLSSDYSYPQIPYKDFSNALVWLSMVVHAGLVGALVYFFLRRSVLCFAIAFYLFNLLMVNNFLFDIGATMGERLIFHSSIGYSIAAAWVLYELMSRFNNGAVGKWTLAVLIIKISLVYGVLTYHRNKDWKNDETLFFHDVKVVPNSFLVNANVGCMLINKADFEKDAKVRTEDLKRGVELFTKVISLQDNYVLAYMNRSVAYFKLGNADSMVADLNRVYRLYRIHPQLPEMYYHAATIYLSNKQYDKAIIVLNQSLELNPEDKNVQNTLAQATKAMQTIKEP